LNHEKDPLRLSQRASQAWAVRLSNGSRNAEGLMDQLEDDRNRIILTLESL